MARFYAVDVPPNLFRQWAAVRRWGRIGAGGQVMEEWFDSATEAESAAERLKLDKVRRGYRLITIHATSD